MSIYHTPVMLKEVIDLLKVKPNHWYIDANLGGGGHTQAILEKGGKVLGIDLDENSIREVAKKFNLNLQKQEGKLIAKHDNFIATQSNFTNIKKLADQLLNSTPLGVLFDLGVSTHQLETQSRGFSFNQQATLDMRMDPTTGVPAKDLINALSEKELAQLFTVYGEENFAKPIAKKIVDQRKKSPITTTNQLAQIITSIRHRTPQDRTHPATRVFQALRIAVNDELHCLQEALPQAFEILKPKGRLVLLSFHSLEDRIVKNFFKDLTNSKMAQLLTKKPLEPTDSEIQQNSRSRSAKLRAIEKI